MAEKTKKEETTTESTSTETPTTKVEGLETTTTNDNAIAINQTDSSAPETVSKPPAEKVEPVAEEKKTPEQPVATATAPIIVSEADVAAAQKESDPHESLSEQIEVLTGEVQALEAKIEHLTGGLNTTAEAQPAEKPAAETTPPLKAAEAPESIVSTPTVAETPTPAVEPAKPESTPTKPVNDIYANVESNAQRGQTAPSGHKDLNDDATLDEETSGIGTIGEVLVVFGLIALLLLLVSPLLKSMVGGSWDAIKSIGWPTTVISLGLGFLLYLFNKGRALFKIFALLLVIVSAVMYLAIFDYSSYLGPLAEMLSPIASFYK